MKVRKQFVSMILSTILVFSFFPLSAYAGESGVDRDDGNREAFDPEKIQQEIDQHIDEGIEAQNSRIDVESSKTEINDSNGNSTKVADDIDISTPEELDNVRLNLAGNYRLVNDIDLSEYNNGNGWEPIGTDSDFFSGTFSGMGFKIKGLNCSGYENGGLFGTNEGRIENLSVDGTVSGAAADQGSVGGIVGFNSPDGIVSNCTNEASVTTEANGYANYCAGVVGYNMGKVVNCENVGTINATSSATAGDDSVYCGGITAYSSGEVSGNNSGKISCVVKSKVQAAIAGGVVGFNINGKVSNSTNTGEIYSKSFKYAPYAGGVVGFGTGLIDGCSNSAYIHADNDNSEEYVNCGGVIGSYSFTSSSDPDDEIVDCSNVGEIYAKGKNKVYIGGIAGSLASEDCLVETCSNSGPVTGDVYYDDFDNEVNDGGIVGYSRGVVYRSYNTGAIRSNGFYFNYGSSGGVAGCLDEGTIFQCYNKGTINGFLRSAGICASNYGTIVDCYNIGTIKGSSEADYMGGIVGGNFTGGKVGFVYNVGVISNASYSEYNGIIGYNGDTCTDNVYNLSWSGYPVDDHSIGSRCSYGTMKNMYTYDSFDFRDTWSMGTGAYKLPILKACADADEQANNKISISNAPFKLGYTTTPYTGKAKKPSVSLSGLTSGTDFAASYSNNIKIGTAKVTINGKGVFYGTRNLTFKIDKKKNTLTVKPLTATVKYSKVKKKNQTLKRSAVLSVSKAKGTVTYTKASGNKKITISKAGKVTIKKKLKKGTYKVKVKVKAAGTSYYKSLTKTVTFKIKVK